MIARLEGRLRVHFSGDPPPLGVRRYVVDVAGVGYLVTCSAITAELLGVGDTIETFALFIHTKISETAMQLFGFASVEELVLFEILIGADQIGPSTALALLAGFGSVHATATAIAEGDEVKLRAVKGVGPKTVRNLVAQLAARLQRELEAGALG